VIERLNFFGKLALKSDAFLTIRLSEFKSTSSKQHFKFRGPGTISALTGA
jgi:hypothetical protein